MVKLKRFKTAGVIALLIIAILTIVVFGFSCVGGLMPVGWSGGAVSNGILYVGSLEGRLVSVNMTDQSILRAEKLIYPQQGGLFGCSLATSCGAGSASVPIYGTPVVTDTLVYIASYNGKIYAYNVNNLAQRWVFPREGYAEAFVGSMVIADGKLYIGCSDGYVYALDAATGDLLSTFKTEDKIWGAPTVDGDTLYIGSFDKKLYALNTADLTLKWSFTAEGSIIAQPLVYNGVVYFGSFDRNFYALNASDGTLKWKFTAQNWFWAQPVIVNDALYIGCLDGFVYVLNASTGVELAQPLNLVSPVASQPVVFENYVIFASHNGGVYKIDTTTRAIVQIAAFESTIDGPLTINDGIIYFQTKDAYLQHIDLRSGDILPSIPLLSQ